MSPENQPQDNVWISREEYERLRVAASQPQPQLQQPNQTVNATQPQAVVQAFENPDKVSHQQVITGLVLGLMVILSLSFSIFRFFAIPAILIFLVFAILNIIDFVRAGKGLNGAATTSKRRHTYKILLIVGVSLLVVPVVSYMALILFFVLLFSLGGGPSS